MPLSFSSAAVNGAFFFGGGVSARHAGGRRFRGCRFPFVGIAVSVVHGRMIIVQQTYRLQRYFEIQQEDLS
jgi:hypothetical protein